MPNATFEVGFIDDKADFLDHLQEELQTANFVIKTTRDPAECLEWVRHDEIDALVADLRMPEEDGLSLIEQVQILSDIETMVLTGYEPNAFESQRARDLSVPIYRKDSLPEFADKLSSQDKDREVRKLLRRLRIFEGAHEEWVKDLIGKLKDIPHFETLVISSEEGPFTVEELIRDIRELRPRGREYIRLWQRTLGTFLKLGRKS